MAPLENGHLAQFIYVKKSRAYAIVHVVIVVGDGVRQVCELCFQSRLRAIQESLADVAQQSRILRGAVFEHAFATFKREIETGKLRVALLELVHDSQRL